MSEEQKPATTLPVATEPAAEAGTASTEATAPEVTEAATPATEEAIKPAEETAAPAEEKEDVVEPITSGVLSYSAPGNFLKSILGLKQKYYFWAGDEAVPTQKLSHYLAAGKPEFTHPTAAWSSQTGKGLLYFAKTAETKDTPTGVLALSDVDEIKPVGTIEFTFKLHGKNHVFLAESEKERNGWIAGLKPVAEEAKGTKKGLHESEGFLAAAALLGAPAAIATSAAKAEGSAPKKSSDSKSVERSARSEDSGKKKSSKDRSQSRGKAFLNSLRGKKEEAEQKAEAKKEEVKEEGTGAKEEPAVEAPPAVEAAEAPVAAAVVAEEAAPATEEAKEEAPKEEPKKEETKARRGSRFLDFVKGAVSPTHEKKLDEVVPATTAAEPVATETEPIADTAPVVPAPTELAAVEPVVAEPAATEAAAEEAAPVNGESKAAAGTATTEAKEKRRSSFFGTFVDSIKKAGERVEKKIEDKVEGTKEEPKPEEAEAVKEAEPKEAEPKVETKKETPVQKFTGLLRNPSKVIRGNKEGKRGAKAPEKVEEAPAAPAAEEAAKPVETIEPTAEKSTEIPAPTGPTSIGDVVPEAVNVGSAPPPSQTVQATA